MKRRTFLKALLVAPLAAAFVKIEPEEQPVDWELVREELFKADVGEIFEEQPIQTVAWKSRHTSAVINADIEGWQKP